MQARAKNLNHVLYGRCTLVDLATGRGVYCADERFAPFAFIDLEAAHEWLIEHCEPVERAPYPLRDRCGRGHRYTEDNTLVYPSGRRECRACRYRKVGERACARKDCPITFDVLSYAQNKRYCSLACARQARLPSHCPQGHAYTEDNTWVRRAANGWLQRKCRTCNRERTRARRRVTA